jgi:hypothetical protein
LDAVPDFFRTVGVYVSRKPIPGPLGASNITIPRHGDEFRRTRTAPHSNDLQGPRSGASRRCSRIGFRNRVQKNRYDPDLPTFLNSAPEVDLARANAIFRRGVRISMF